MRIPGNEPVGVAHRPYYGNLSDYEQKQTIGIRGYESPKNLRGIHSGKGPRSLPRTDRRLMEIICDELTEDPYVDASDIEINVSNREVTVTGIVDNREIKRRVEDLIEGIRDIENIENKLELKNRFRPGYKRTQKKQNEAM